MSPLVKLVLVLFGLAYLISPVDLIPDLLIPWVGWIDDSLVLWCVYYLIRYGELPWFLFKRPGGRRSPARPGSASGPGPTGQHGDGSPNNRNKAANQKSRHNPGNQSGPGQDRGETREDKNDDPDSGQVLRSPHEVLDVAGEASWDEIQQAYKEKIKQYHPDKLSHLGEEFSTLANEKFLEIQDAYSRLKQAHKKD